MALNTTAFGGKGEQPKDPLATLKAAYPGGDFSGEIKPAPAPLKTTAFEKVKQGALTFITGLDKNERDLQTALRKEGSPTDASFIRFPLAKEPTPIQRFSKPLGDQSSLSDVASKLTPILNIIPKTLLETIPKATVELYLLRKDINNVMTWNNEPIKNADGTYRSNFTTQLPFDARRLGFENSGPVTSVATRFMEKVDKLSQEDPKASPYKIGLQAMWEEVVPVAMDFIVAGDLVTGAAKGFLKLTAYDPQVEWAFSKYGMTPREFAGEGGMASFKQRFQDIGKQLIEKQDYAGMQDLARATQIIGGKMNETGITALNPVFQQMQDIARNMVVPIQNIGVGYKGTSLYEPPAGTALPGTRPVPGQAPAFGLSTEQIEPVGKGNPIPASQATPFDRRFVKVEEIRHSISDLGNPEIAKKLYNNPELMNGRFNTFDDLEKAIKDSLSPDDLAKITNPSAGYQGGDLQRVFDTKRAYAKPDYYKGMADGDQSYRFFSTTKELDNTIKPNIVYRGEGAPKGPMYSGNLFGEGKYVSPDPKVAEIYGEVTKYSHSLKPEEIFDVPTQQALDKLYSDATKAFIDSPKLPNELIPEYLKSKGYKAVRAVGDLAQQDPLIGMNVFDSNVLDKVIPQIAKEAPKVAKAITPTVQDIILKTLPEKLADIQPKIVEQAIVAKLVAEGITSSQAKEIAKMTVEKLTQKNALDFTALVKKKVGDVLKLSGNSLKDVSIIGSTAAGKENPNDLDILITPTKSLAKLSSVPKTSSESAYNRQDLANVFKSELQSLFPGKTLHVTLSNYDSSRGGKISIEEFYTKYLANNAVTQSKELSQTLKDFAERAKDLTIEEFSQQFTQGLKAQNLTVRDTAKNILKTIQDGGFATPEEFYSKVVKPTTNFPEGFKPYMRTITGDTVDIKKLTDPAYFVQAYESTFARMAGTDEKLYKILTKNLVPEGKEASGYLANLYNKAKAGITEQPTPKPTKSENQKFLKTISKEVEAGARLPKKLIDEATVNRNIPPNKIIEKNTGIDKGKPETVERTQKQLLRKEEVVSKRGFRAGGSAMRTKIYQELAETNASIADIKKQITDYVKDNLSPKDRGKANIIIRDAKTQKDLVKAFVRINRWAEDAEKKAVRNEILKQYKRAIDSPSVAVDYKDKIKEVLADFELKGHTKDTMDKLKSTKKFIEERVKAGDDVELPQRLWNALNILAKKPFKEIALKELTGALEEINRLVDLGKLKWETKEQLYKYEKDAITKQLLAETKPLSKLSILKPGIGEKLSPGQLFRNKIINTINWFNRADKVLLPIDVLADMLDGGKGTFTGPNSSLIKRRIDYNFSNYLDTKFSIQDPVIKLAKDLKLKDGNFERMGIVAARDQEDGVEKLMNSGYTKAEVDAIKLTPDEQRVLDAMRATFESQYPYIVQIMKDVYNEPVGKVKNYFSFMTDWKNVDEIEVFRRMGQNVDQFGRPAKNVEQGFTKERVGAGTQKIKVNALDVFLKHTDNTSYLRTMAKDSRMLYEVINSPEYGKAAGDLGQLFMLEWIDLVVRKGGKAGANQIASIDFIRKNIGAAMLGFKLSSAAIQWTTVLDAAGLIGPEWAGKGAMAVGTSREWREFALKFPELRNRAGGDFAIKELQDGTWLDKAKHVGFIPLEKLDQLSAMSTVIGAYKKKMQELGLDIDLTQAPNKEAMNYAQLMVRRTQASPIFKDVPLAVSRGLLTGNRSLDRAMLQFQNFVLFRWALIRYEALEAGMRSKNYKGVANLLFWLMMATVGVVGTRLGISRLTDFVTGKEQKDPLEKQATRAMTNELAGTVPFMGNIFGAYMYDNGFFPVLDAPQEIFSGARSAITGKSLTTKAKGATDFLAGISKTLVGLPGTQQAQQIIKNVIPEAKTKSKQKAGLPKLPALPKLQKGKSLPKLPKLPSL